MAIHDVILEAMKWLNDYGIKQRVTLARVLSPITQVNCISESPPPAEGRRVGPAVDLAEAFTMKPYIQHGSEYTAPGYGLGVQLHLLSHMQQPMLDCDVIYFTLHFFGRSAK